jgi:hypothetical protein
MEDPSEDNGNDVPVDSKDNPIKSQNIIPVSERVQDQVKSQKVSSHQSYLQNPFIVLFISLLFALLYAFLPDLDYWFYYLVKNQLWATLTLIECVEMQTINIPDIHERTYFLTYFCGFISTFILHTIVYFAGGTKYQNNVYILALSVITPVIVIYVIYGIDCFQQPEIENANKLPKYRVFEPKDKNSNLSLSRKSNLWDIFPKMSMAVSKKKFRTMFVATGLKNDLDQSAEDEDDDGQDVGKESAISVNPIHSEMQPSACSTSSANMEVDKNEISNRNRGNNSFGHYLQSFKYYFPRYWNMTGFKQMQKMRNFDRRALWFYSTCFSFIFCVNYIFLVILTINFRENSNIRLGVVLFIIFILGTTFLRLLLKTIGSILDSTKKLSISMYFMAEFACLLFYYTFYRVLFRSIDDIFVFIVFQFLHLSSEWILYVIRTSEWFFHWSEKLILTYFTNWFFIQKPRFTLQEWEKLMTLDYGIRIVVLITSTYTIILLLVVIQYLPWVQDDLPQNQSEFQFTMLLLCLALVSELINAWVMNEIYFKPKNLDAVEEVKCCFQNISFGILLLFIGCNLFINPVFAFTSDSRVVK